MKFFIVYDKTTGEIRRVGICQGADLERQADPDRNEIAIEGNAPGTNMVVDGTPVYIEPLPPPPPTPEEIAAQDENKFASDTMRLIGKAFFNHENRLRVLEGKSAITWNQFKAAIRGLA
jgi:hypothetical protein